MSEEDVDVVREYFEHLVESASVKQRAAARERMRRVADPEIQYQEDPKWPGSQRYAGFDAVQECFERYLDYLSISASVEEVRDTGDEIVVLLRSRGESVPSGVPFDHLWGYVCRVRDGKLAYLQAYVDPNEAIESAGLRE